MRVEIGGILPEIEYKTVLTPWALWNLHESALEVSGLPGSVAECGVFLGGSLRLLARSLPGKTVYGFDTFAGMPEGSCGDVDHHKPGDFGRSNLGVVRKYLGDLDNVVLVPGEFPVTFGVIAPGEKFCLVHLDCDQYASYKAALDFFLPRMVEGGLLVIDDYCYLQGAKLAVDERFPGLPGPPATMRLDNGGWSILRKRLEYAA